jgi:hypothetical protein
MTRSILNSRKLLACPQPFPTSATFAALFLLLAYPSPAQQDFSKVEIKVTKVAGTVYMLEGAGGNIGVSVGEDGVVLVDDQFAPLAPKSARLLRVSPINRSNLC